MLALLPLNMYAYYKTIEKIIEARVVIYLLVIVPLYYTAQEVYCIVTTICEYYYDCISVINSMAKCAIWMIIPQVTPWL